MVAQEQGNSAVVLCAAFLHDIGIHEAEKKYNSTGARYHEKEGPPIAREILTRLGAAEALIDEVCHIIAHHHRPGADETANFKIVYDADLIVNLEKRYRDGEIDRQKVWEIIEKTSLTETGKRLARETFLGDKK
jgi:HD superfamily phosphodiesterase